jgi:hypothetical protein
MKLKAPPIPKPKESDVQGAIKDALSACGFTVRHTSAFRQKAPSGVDKGIPDLLVFHASYPGWYLGMEVKTDVGKPSPEQKIAMDAGEYPIVRKPSDALYWAEANFPNLTSAELAKVATMADKLRKVGQ